MVSCIRQQICFIQKIRIAQNSVILLISVIIIICYPASSIKLISGKRRQHLSVGRQTTGRRYRTVGERPGVYRIRYWYWMKSSQFERATVDVGTEVVDDDTE
ncbi:hypothetical protein BO71DRAFT_12975 [Aspergillus ellipticus CBS 707.79]|uniref:Uncharacterized protein n=1 Tax=Aspergillus ellipticus CBS 707.79 TaxID=1448320 RepID=A0A319DXG6_9EURO|nr:hypothetical protein BO71DRAFT_12975 [Aspergillus ellipticus CBS 707.79]